MGLKVAIVGAGPAGCMLARLLLNSDQNISATIFESEASMDFRSQGGTLDLHKTTGQAALKRAGLFNEFLKHARYDGEAFKVSDKKFLCYVKMDAGKKGSGSGRPEIDRPRLRELLFYGLPERTVQWNKKVVRVDKDLFIHFADGTSQNGFDLIVGADGAWSKVRPLLSEVKPYYSGIGGLSMVIPDAERNAPELYDIVGRGSLFVFSDRKSIMGQYMGDGSISVATWAAQPETWQQDYDVGDAAAVRRVLRDNHADWDPRLVDLTQRCEDKVTPRDLYMLPIGHRWAHVPGVTLVGDAAHLMTPFAGEGVNLALQDSLKLAEAILRAAKSRAEDLDRELDQQVAKFEQDMFDRATATQQMTYDMMVAMFFSRDAPRTGIERYILTAARGPEKAWYTCWLAPFVYTWFFVFKLIW